MGFLTRMRSFGAGLSWKRSGGLVSDGSAALISGSEISKLGTAGSYNRIYSSGGICRTDPNLEKRLGDVVYAVYFMLGAGFLLPWNAFITAVDYFSYLYPDSHADRVFSVSYLLPCLVVLPLLIVYGQRFGARERINLGLGLFVFSIVVVPIMDVLFINGERASSWTYFVTVGAVVLAGVGDALVQGTLIGSAGHLPDRFTQAIVCGTGFSGVLVSLLRIVTKDAFPDTPSGLRSSAKIYFGVSAVFLVLCVFSYNGIHGVVMKMACKNESEPEEALEKGLIIESGSDSGDEEETRADGLNFGVGADETTLYNGQQEARDSSAGPTTTSGSSPSAGVDLEKGNHLVAESFRWMQMLSQLSWLAAAMTATYVITLAIFPGFLTEDVTSVALGDWYPVLLIGCFNVFDLVGKSLPATYASKQIHSFGWAAARLLFIPLYAACVHGPRSFRTETPVFVLTGLLGLSNGYLTTSFFIGAPKGFKNGSLDAEAAGVVMVLALELGLTLGSFVGWVWVI